MNEIVLKVTDFYANLIYAMITEDVKINHKEWEFLEEGMII